ncbi:dihydrofolate reductase family protein [Kribbella sp. NPDC056861]|uniref:dihydrofolate reductase family protein n=1 Tax=Kribbella sp. NPDC056861 TaxID=3154857 RepID=UPI003427C154
MSTPASRTVVGNIALSLDGRISGTGGPYDMGWIVPHATTDGSRSHMLRVTSQAATTVLLGRNNYEGFGGFWPGVAEMAEADPKDREFSRWLNEVEKVVFSTTLQQTPWANSRLATADPATTVKELRQQEGGDIVVLASTSIIQNLLEADELDRLSITLAPELVGGGARFFPEGLPGTSWSLADSTPTESGALCLLYNRNR